MNTELEIIEQLLKRIQPVDAGFKSFSTAEEALVYFTDCQIATYQYAKSLKRTSAGELRRHRNIAARMILACGSFALKEKVDPLIARFNRGK